MRLAALALLLLVGGSRAVDGQDHHRHRERVLQPRGLVQDDDTPVELEAPTVIGVLDQLTGHGIHLIRDAKSKLVHGFKSMWGHLRGKGPLPEPLMEYADAMKAKASSFDASKTYVVLIPSFSGSSLYLQVGGEQRSSAAKKCGKGKHDRVWVGKGLAASAGIPGPLSKAKQECTLDIMKLDVEKNEDREGEGKDPAPWTYTQKPGQTLKVRTGNVEDLRGVLPALMGGLTDSADIFDDVIKVAHRLAIPNDNIYAGQYDWRMPTHKEGPLKDYYAGMYEWMAGLPADAKVTFVTFSLGSPVFHHFLHYAAEQKGVASVLGKTSNVVHMAPAEGGSVDAAFAMLYGNSAVERLLGRVDPKKVQELMRGGGSWPTMLPPKSSTAWMRDAEGDLKGSKEFPGVLKELLTAEDNPGELDVTPIADMYEWTLDREELRHGKMVEAYGHMTNAQVLCAQGTNVPTWGTLYWNEERKQIRRGVLARGDGTVQTLNAIANCKEFAEATGNEGRFMPLVMEPKDVAKIYAEVKKVKGDEQDVVLNKLRGKSMADHGNSGRLNKDVIKAFIAALVGDPSLNSSWEPFPQ